ncbi:unnamed protein product, partial [Staurois parvus]
KSRHVRQISRQRRLIHHSRERLHCFSVKGFTALHPTLCISLGDVRLGCSCSTMKTHSIKLCTHRCANLKAT